MAKFFSAFVKREGEQIYVPLADGEQLYFGDTVKLKLADDLRYGTASERRRIALKGILNYSLYAVIKTAVSGGWYPAVIYQKALTDTDEAENAEIVLELNNASAFALAAGNAADAGGCKVMLSCLYRVFCDKYLGGVETLENAEETESFFFVFSPYSRDFTAELTVKNVWDPAAHQLREGPFTVAECAENGYEAVFNGTTLSRPADSIKETAFRVVVKEIEKSVTVGGQAVTAASYPAVFVENIRVNGPALQYEISGTERSPLEGSGLAAPVYDTGWQPATTDGDIRVLLTDSTGQVHSTELPLFGTGDGRAALYRVGDVWLGNTEQITVERARGEDVNGAVYYDSANPAANTCIRISGITAALSQTVTVQCLHSDSRAAVRVFAALRTEGMTDFLQETELTDSGDARGFHGVIPNTAMTKAYFVRIRAVDCYGQEAAVVKLSPAPLSENFPTVFKAKAKTREAEFWWPVTFCGGLKAVRMDKDIARVNLNEHYIPGLYYALGSLNGTNTETVYQPGEPAPYRRCIVLTVGDGETEGMQMIFHEAYIRDNATFCCELRYIYKSGDAWDSYRLWRN